MSDPRIGAANAVQGLLSGQTSQSLAKSILEQHSRGGLRDVGAIDNALTTLAARDPVVAAQVRKDIDATLTPVERGQLAAANDTAPKPAKAGPGVGEVALDVTQLALDIVGIFEPTPFADGTNAVISVGRGIYDGISQGSLSAFGGRMLDAGLSAVGVVPYLGDAAKLGKIGRWAETVTKAVSLAAKDPGVLKAIAPDLKKISDAIGSAPLDKLPASARETLEGMKKQIDDLLGAGAKNADDAAALATRRATSGRNEVTWTLDAKGQPTQANATLSELQPKGVKRGQSELDAQDNVRARGIADDDAGHIIGHRFMGDQGPSNMFPQNFNFNRSAYKTMENEWAAWIENGATVKVNVSLKGGTEARPAQVGVSYEVFDAAGKRVFKNSELFDNAAGQAFDRVSTADIKSMLGK